MHFLKENVWILIKISLKFVPKCKCPINNIPALVQIIAWRQPGDKPLSEPVMVILLMHTCVTQPQWVNAIMVSGSLRFWTWGPLYKIHVGWRVQIKKFPVWNPAGHTHACMHTHKCDHFINNDFFYHDSNLVENPFCSNSIHNLPVPTYFCKSHNRTAPGPWFNKKMSSYQYRKSHCGDKTILRLSYLHNGISYTGKTASLY